MERQNKGELLNSLYAASSHAERCLSQLTDSLEESELLDLCAKFYTPLFENGRKVHAWIPDTVLPQLELELAGVDPELVTRLTESLNEFALLIIMIQLYSQISEEMKNNDVFAQIISNFRALADQAVHPLPEGADLLPGDGKAGSQLVTAEALQQIGALL